MDPEDRKRLTAQAVRIRAAILKARIALVNTASTINPDLCSNPTRNFDMLREVLSGEMGRVTSEEYAFERLFDEVKRKGERPDPDYRVYLPKEEEIEWGGLADA